MTEPYPSFRWWSPTRLVFGVHQLARLPELVEETAGPGVRVLLVTGRQSLRARGALDVLLDSLGRRRVTLFDRVTPFPSPALADEAAEACRACGADVVVAVGGGSALDVGKAAAFLAPRSGLAVDFATGRLRDQRPGLPFIAVPTTAGSSSEVTPSAALWDLQARRHYVLSSPQMFPTVALVDPHLTMSMDGPLAANSGMDAFTSALESFWSVEANPASDALALEAITLFRHNLVRSVIQKDLESRTACALAATLSGMAYSNSRPNACHAVGSPLTLHWSIPHGQAVAVTLPAFLRWNARAIAHKAGRLWQALGVSGLEEAVELIERVLRRSGLQTRLSALGLGREDVDLVVAETRWELMERLPRPIGWERLRDLLLGLV